MLPAVNKKYIKTKRYFNNSVLSMFMNFISLHNYEASTDRLKHVIAKCIILILNVVTLLICLIKRFCELNFIDLGVAFMKTLKNTSII